MQAENMKIKATREYKQYKNNNYSLKKERERWRGRNAGKDYKAELQFEAYRKYLVSICRLITWTVGLSRHFKYSYYNSNFTYFSTIQ